MAQSPQHLKVNADETEPTFHDLPSGASDSEPEAMSETGVDSVLEQALLIAEQLKQPQEWKLVIKDKSGVLVKYAKIATTTTSAKRVTVYRGEKVLEGWALETVYAAIRDREAWDDWLEASRTLKALDKETRIFYLAIKSPVPSSKPRDFVLLEKTFFTPTTISIISKSIPSLEHYPEQPGRLRSSMGIMTWDLQRCTSYDGRESTKLTYSFQAKLKGWLQGSLSKKVMAKRPLVIKRVEWYLNNRYPAPVSAPTSNKTTTKSLSEEEEAGKERATLTEKSSVSSLKKEGVTVEIPSLIIENNNDDDDDNNDNNDQNGEKELETSSLRNPKLEGDKYLSLLEQAKSSYQKLLPLESGWKFYDEKEGVKIYTTDRLEGAFPAVRGEGTIVGWKKEEIWTVISLPSCRLVWDERFEGSEVVKRFGPNAYLAKSLIKGMFPVSGRDLALVASVTTNQNSLESIATSIDDDDEDASELIPLNPKRIRAHLDLSAWSLKESRGEDGRLVVEVLYMVSTDLKGSIPGAIVKKALPQTPLCIARIQDYLNSHGSPPFVITPSKVANEEGVCILRIDYSVESGRWEIEATGAGHVDIHVGSRLANHQSGWDLQVEGPANSVTKLNDVVVRVPLSETTSSLIALEKGSFKLTLNGQLSRFQTIEVQPSITPNLLSKVNSATMRSVGNLSPLPEQIENPYQEVVEGIKETLTDILSQDWTMNGGEKNGIKMSLLERGQMIYSRGDGTLDGWKAQDIMAVIRSLDCRRVWDDKLALAKRVKSFGPQSSLVHFAVKGQFPVGARDFAVLTETYLDKSDAAIVNVGTFVEDPDIPISSEYVRGKVNLVGWILKDRAVEASRSKPLVDCTFISSIDLKGSIPSKALKTIQTQAPLVIARVRDYLDKYPVPPYFTRNALLLESDEVFNPSTGEWRVKLSSPESRLVSGAEITVCDLPPVKGAGGYDQGYEIIIEPAELANVVRIQRGFRLIVPGGARLELSIKPGRRGGVRVNGLLLGEQSVAKSEEVATLVIREEIQRRSVIFEEPPAPIPAVIEGEAEEKKKKKGLRRERGETQPNVMVKVINWQGLSESQVFFVAILVFCSFYLGLLYERYVVSGLLRNW